MSRHVLSAAQPAQGSTIYFPWIPAHAAIQRAWPFLVQRAALEGAPLAGKASGAIAPELPPVGNTGGSFRSVQNV